jgi:hypothetical protein
VSWTKGARGKNGWKREGEALEENILRTLRTDEEDRSDPLEQVLAGRSRALPFSANRISPGRLPNYERQKRRPVSGQAAALERSVMFHALS